MIQSSMNRLMSLTGDMIRVYPLLREVIVEAQQKNDPKKYIAFRSASIRGRWFAESYLSRRRDAGMKRALITLSETLLKSNETAKTIAHLDINMIREMSSQLGITGNKNFLRLEEMLPDVLIALAGKSGKYGDTLRQLAKRLKVEADKTYALIEYYETLIDPEVEEAKQREENLVGQQNVAVEALINSVLEGLDKKAAHSIRALLARSDNKLLVLEQELLKLA